MLRAAAGDPIKLLKGKLEFTHFFAVGNDLIEVNHRLNSSFAKRRFANNDPAVIVLNGTGKNFGSRGAEPVGQYYQRSAVGNLLVIIGKNINPAGRGLHLHDRPLFNEQAGQINGFGKGTSSIITQINDE